MDKPPQPEIIICPYTKNVCPGLANCLGVISITEYSSGGDVLHQELGCSQKIQRNLPCHLFREIVDDTFNVVLDTTVRNYKESVELEKDTKYIEVRYLSRPITGNSVVSAHFA